MLERFQTALATRIQARAERNTYYPVIAWNLRPEAKKLLQQSNGNLVVAGNMPDTIASGKNRYVDTPENWHVQKQAIHGVFLEWANEMLRSGQKNLTVTLCSGSRGVDLDMYDEIRQYRALLAQQGNDTSLTVVSFLPLQKADFREESVLGSRRESYYDNLFQELTNDPQAIVHEPHFVPYRLGERQTLATQPVTADAASERSKFINGQSNGSIHYSDTQRQLMHILLMSPNPKQTRFVIVTDGGKAYGPGGTNEMVARIYEEFGTDLTRRTKNNLPTIHVIQAGVTVKRPLARVLERAHEEKDAAIRRETYKYIQEVKKAYSWIKKRRWKSRVRGRANLWGRNVQRKVASALQSSSTN